jgi:hypothetical protein
MLFQFFSLFLDLQIRATANAPGAWLRLNRRRAASEARRTGAAKAERKRVTEDRSDCPFRGESVVVE